MARQDHPKSKRGPLKQKTTRASVQAVVTENQLKVIKDKYLRDASSVEAWLEGVARNIALAEILLHPKAEEWGALEGVSHRRQDGLLLLHEGLAEASQREANFSRLMQNLERAYSGAPEARALVDEWAARFLDLMAAWDFLPNSPTLM